MIRLQGITVIYYTGGMRSAGHGQASITISDESLPQIVIESAIPENAKQMQFSFSVAVAGQPEAAVIYSQLMDIMKG